MVIVRADSVECRSVEDLSKKTMQEVAFTGSVAGISVTNETEPSKLFCARNAHTFGGEIP